MPWMGLFPWQQDKMADGAERCRCCERGQRGVAGSRADRAWEPTRYYALPQRTGVRGTNS
jgi:hypothetical protein